MAVQEITLIDLPLSYDWQEVFGEGGGGNTNKNTDPSPPQAELDLTPPRLVDVVEIIAAVNGENDGQDWVGVFLLSDGRYCVASGSCDYTGWDCQAGNHLQVAATLDDALTYGLTAAERERLDLKALYEELQNPPKPVKRGPRYKRLEFDDDDL